MKLTNKDTGETIDLTIEQALDIGLLDHCDAVDAILLEDAETTVCPEVFEEAKGQLHATT